MSKDGYHHGDLANALISAALAAVEQGGPEAVSLREIAQSLGVSRAAPYRHFADRDQLLAAVAARGFEDLNTAYKTAMAKPGDGKQRLDTVNRAYFEFATARPGLHRLMFESDLLNRTPPAAVLIPPANESYDLLVQSVAGAYPDESPKAIKARTIAMLSLSYGFLSLDRAGRFKPFMIEPLTHEELVEAVLTGAVGRGGD